MEIKKTGAFIAERRKAMRMTQKELALKLNVTDKAVSKWERRIGYPEITTIPLLAELLGVSSSEIMLGEQAEPSRAQSNIQETPQPDAIVSNTVEYMKQLQGQKGSRAKEIAFVSLSGALFIGVFVCGLCNYILSARFDWSLYVFGSAVLAWLVTAPLLKFKKYRSLFSMAGLSVTIVPFLLLIEYLGSAKNWVIPFALPIIILSLASLWAFVLLLLFVKMRLANRIALAMILFGVFENLAIQYFVRHYLKLPSSAQNNPSSAIVAITCAFIAIGLFTVMTLSKKQRK